MRDCRFLKSGMMKFTRKDCFFRVEYAKLEVRKYATSILSSQQELAALP
jgi:hypothetical protein